MQMGKSDRTPVSQLFGNDPYFFFFNQRVDDKLYELK